MGIPNYVRLVCDRTKTSWDAGTVAGTRSHAPTYAEPVPASLETALLKTYRATGSHRATGRLACEWQAGWRAQWRF